ncbi:Echinoderm microtubule-associated protein-like 5 [Chamberlinius hualienensis]
MKLGGEEVVEENSKSDDMLSNENDSLAGRVAELEKKMQEQEDELVCLKGTLADVVRRLAAVESAPRAPIVMNHIGSGLRYPKDGSSNIGRRFIGPSGLPTSYTNNGINSAISRRPPHHHQSNNSLHSDSHSSSSVSPVPSPSPNSYYPHPPSPSTQTSARSSPSPRHTPLASRSNSQTSMKKWSSSIDCSKTPVNSNRDAIYNSEDGFVKLYLRGRPINLYGSDHLMQEYTLAKVDNLPSNRLKLDWVYGYRGRDCRSNLHYLPTGEMVYCMAAVVVLFNLEENTQRHYMGHTDDVKCLAIHPNKLLIASGQVAGHDRREGRPHVRIWDSVSLNTHCILGLNGDFERSIACIGFSKLDGGSLLCVIDEAHDHSFSVWDWQKGDRGQKIVETKSSADPVLAVEFHPMDKNVIISCGKGHVNFWTMEGTTLLKSSGIFDKNKPKFVHCLTFTETGELVTGDSNGNILVWDRGSNRVSRVISGAHDCGIFSICAMKDGSFVSGGGKDRRLREWGSKLQPTSNYYDFSDMVGAVRTIAQGKGNFILVGTTKNCILQGTVYMGFQTCVQGHTEELWGLAIHPNQSQFVTAGQDGYIHLWDTMSHSVVWSYEIKERAQAAAFSPNGNVLVMTTTTGKWFALDAETREIYSQHVDGIESIDVVRFSPDGNYLALGSHDNNIYIYQVEDQCHKYSRVGRCAGHSSFVTHLDWSTDGSILRSNSADLELLYWTASTCRQITAPAQVKNIEWISDSCPINFNVLGIWPEGADGSDVNCCSSSHSQKLLATGDDWGKIKLFNYPSCHPKALCYMYGGHSSHVTSVDFMFDDTSLISTGGRDGSIMQWKVW